MIQIFPGLASCSAWSSDQYGMSFWPRHDFNISIEQSVPSLREHSLVADLLLVDTWHRYWCTDQMIVQITLSARDLSNAKMGCVVAACLKIFPVFLMVLPGMISRTLWPSDIACQTADECERACGSPNGCTNVAYPTLVMRLLPSGLKGLLFSVMLSALMSSLSSTFNSG